MGLSKSQRIILLLIIDTVFFFIELIVGYAVHSLALVADAFHMLNDVLSLCVGLWAVKVANQNTSSKVYTYGWQRAETLGALVNGVFLVALCLSIFLEAIQRFVEPQEVTNPKLVLIVGCLGLFSNIVGLLLFHDHTHGHGHSHAQVSEEPLSSVERGYSTTQEEGDTAVVSSQSGTIAGVMPENALDAAEQSQATARPARRTSGWGYSSRRGSRRLSMSGGYRDADDIYTHPASLRQDIIKASRFEDESPEGDDEGDTLYGGAQPSERSPLLERSEGTTPYSSGNGTQAGGGGKDTEPDLHRDHNHAQPATTKKSGHSHDLNMRGVFLHVMGDALGNIGVIASALVIWLTSYSWRYYVDPGISLLITVIILWSAIPLCKAASRILLQAVPPDMSVDHIIEDIESLPGIVSCHHLHVWQLSDTNIVSSLHIKVSHDIKGEGSDRYMELARQVRSCLHAYGIHSSTIQPEFAPDTDSDGGASFDSGTKNGNVAQRSGDESGLGAEPPACLLDCRNECGPGRQCCPPSPKK